MIPPPRPENEEQRLSELRELDVLDSIPEQAYDDLTRIAAGICRTPIGLVSLIDSDRQWFKSRVGLEPPETPRDVAFCAHAIVHPRELFVVADAREDPRFIHNPLVTGAPHIRFYAGAPLVGPNGNAYGTLCIIDTEPRELDPFQSSALVGLSRQVSALLELRRTARRLRHQLAERAWYENQLREQQAELRRENAELSEQSRTDALTGLPNRRAFTAALTRAIEHARGGAAPLAMAVIDADHFKTINDLHGHAVGDEVLVAIAQTLHAQRGPHGMVARVGGEEFSMLIDARPETAQMQCDYLREAIQNLAIGLPVTVSIGLSVLRPDDDARSLYARADEALYAAKRGGRNRVVVAP
ncbi:MAG TPA: sensor domain-containing diguanylate cyclase [Rudaea sp.]